MQAVTWNKIEVSRLSTRASWRMREVGIADMQKEFETLEIIPQIVNQVLALTAAFLLYVLVIGQRVYFSEEYEKTIATA